MRRSLLVALVAATLLASAVIAANSDLASNYFAGHSGQIVLVGQEQTVRDAHAVFLDSQHYFRGLSASSLSLHSLTHVLAAALRLPVSAMRTLHGAAARDAAQLIPQASVSEVARARPSAHVMFNVESVGAAALERLQLQRLSRPASPHVSVSLSTPSVTPPASALTLAASLATGAPVSSHGIVAPVWKDAKGRVVRAYDAKMPASSFSQVPTFADSITTATEGQGLTLSFSASEQMARAFGVHQTLALTHQADGWTHNYCIGLTNGGTAFRGLGENKAPALDVDTADLDVILDTSQTSLLTNLGAGMSAHLEGPLLTVDFTPAGASQAQRATFDLRQKADQVFVAEMQYALDLPAKIKGVAALHDQLNDAVPDLLVVSFSGLTGLLEQYGRDSEQLSAALHMLDSLFPLLSSEYASLFSSPPMQSLIFLGAHPSVLERADLRPVQAVLADNKIDLTYFPNVYVAPGGDVLAQCQKLNKDLASLHFMAYCPSVQDAPQQGAGHAVKHPHMLVELDAAPDSAAAAAAPASGVRRVGNSMKAGGPPAPAPARPPVGPNGKQDCSDPNSPCDRDVQRYQIILWFSVLIAFVAIAAVYQLAFMSFKKDTMLYSSFNPNWSERKR